MTTNEVKALYSWMSERGFKNVNKQGEAIIKEVLEKQIPKKPNYVGEHYSYCPSCGSLLHMYYEEGLAKGCPQCLQAIDWTDKIKD